MRHVFIVLGVALLCAPAWSAAPSDAEVTHQLRTLAQYPKDVRAAILELLNHPAVLKKVEGEGIKLDKALKGEPASVQDAARLVAKHPEVLQLLKDHPDSLALAAKAYAEHKKQTLAQLDQEEKDNGSAADDWALRLENDQEALKQLKEAAREYAKGKGNSAHDAGVTVAGEGVTVHGHPTPAFVQHVLSNADRYPALSNVMVSQWLSAKNSASYDRAFHHWWGKYENHFHDSLLRPDANRAHRLAELARFDRQHAGVDAAKRYARFHEHAKHFPHLAKLPAHDPKKHKPRTGMHHKPDHHKDAHRPIKKSGTGKGHHAVHRKAGSHEHHMHHAKAGHHHHAQHHAAHHGGKKK
jgi:hypothetical protein